VKILKNLICTEVKNYSIFSKAFNKPMESETKLQIILNILDKFTQYYGLDLKLCILSLV